jgi:hypothetical protein
MSKARLHGMAPIVVAITAITCGCSSSPPPILVSVSPSSPQAVDQGQTVTISATVTNDPSAAGVSWSFSGPGSFSNSTGSSVTYEPPATSLASTERATVTATSIKDTTKNASVQITVNPYLQIPPSQALANGSLGTPYSQTVQLTGGTAPFDWSIYHGSNPITSGSVPDGLMLNTSTGVVSGTPTGAGTWYFEAMVTDAAGATAYDGFLSIQINPSAPAGNPVPFLNQPLVPTSVSPGSNDLTLKVSGTGFVSGATIDFNNTPLTTDFVNSEHLSVMVPAAQLANAGTASVTVVNPAPGGGRSNVVYFQVGRSETTVSFVNAVNSPLQISEALYLVAADFNEDGKPDLAIAGNIRVYVLLGNGDGSFASASGSPISVPVPPYDPYTPYTGPIATGDFNNSGHLGLSVGEFQTQAAAILFGNGDGTFVLSSAVFANGLGQPMSAVTTADFDADGNLDLAITNEFVGTGAPVSLGYGKGAFTAVGSLYTGIFPIGVAVGDFNADGELDAVVASGGTTLYPGSGVNVSLGNGDGTFTLAGGTGIPLGKNLSAIVTGDFNGDGKLDLAVTDYDLNEVMILLGNGDRTFGTPTTIPVGNQPEAVATGDFNNDGKLDLAIANYGDGTVTLLLGNSDGTFTPASGSPYAVGRGPTAIAAADFNGDGKLDLAVVNGLDATGTVSILLQQ